MAIDKTLGYEYICNMSHPLANKSGKVYVHRIIASEKLGRWIQSHEHIHHIDGNKSNNHPENLAILSPSEHAKLEQTLKGNIGREIILCWNCGEDTHNKKFCSKPCADIYSRRFEIDPKELEKLVWTYSTVRVAEMLGVSDKAIEKRCKLHGILKPPRGYWAKVYAQNI